MTNYTVIYIIFSNSFAIQYDNVNYDILGKIVVHAQSGGDAREIVKHMYKNCEVLYVTKSKVNFQ